MTGNVVFLGLAAAGAPGLSVPRSAVALGAFFLGAVIGGRIGMRIRPDVPSSSATFAFAIEASLLLLAAVAAMRGGPDLVTQTSRLYAVMALTGVAMGVRNAVVRKLAVPDLTTTVLTLTITGLAADSSLAGGPAPRTARRFASIMLMLAGAAVGAWVVQRSVALALAGAGLISTACTIAAARGSTARAG
jgi:uncharacterized membrane protein YoaK (UPF0700 family)